MRSKTSLEVIRKLNARTKQTYNKITAVEAEIMQLIARQKRLEDERRRLEDKRWDLEDKRWNLDDIEFHLKRQTRAWNFNRKLERFLQFPLEIREIIYSHYFPITETFAEGCKNSVTLVSQQIRDEVIDWLGRHRPLVLPLRIKHHNDPGPRITFRKVKRSNLFNIPTQILGRVRLLDIRFEPGELASCRLHVISGEVKLIEPSPHIIVVRNVYTTFVCRENMELLGAAVVREGLGLMLPHLKWVISAFTRKTYKDMEARLHREVETRLSLRWLENLPFSDCDAKEFMNSGTCLSLEDESQDDWADTLSRH